MQKLLLVDTTVRTGTSMIGTFKSQMYGHNAGEPVPSLHTKYYRT